jgi:hypothetical protein
MIDGWACRTMWERNVYRVFVWENEKKSPLGRPRHKWEVGTCI